MLEIIKKSIYLGLGIAAVTKEKVEIFVDELIEKGRVPREERSKVVQEIIDKIDNSEAELKSKSSSLHESLSHKLSSFGLATQKDVKELKEMITALQTKNI